MNDKSDIKAKEAYVNYLTEHGYVDVQIVHSPVDSIAYKNGVKHFFEIKATRKNSYFGAATFTEWECALKNKEFFKFVVVKEMDEEYEFYEFTPEEFMEYSTIPPIKVYFNIDLNQKSKVKRNGTALKMSKEAFFELNETYKKLKNNVKKK